MHPVTNLKINEYFINNKHQEAPRQSRGALTQISQIFLYLNINYNINQNINFLIKDTKQT